MAARDIPDEINIHKLINSHIVEIHSLKRQCKTKPSKQSLQRIPRHMRRRAASNNPKRMPKALQQQHGGGNFNDKSGNQTSKKKGTAVAGGPKPRKKKSKSRNVRRRNADPRRTPLHLWFAKRFKLQLKWGQFQPYANNVKNQRTLYRCSKAGYTIFYLPHRCSILVEANSDRKEAALAYLAYFLSPKDGVLLREIVSKNGQTCSVDLYAPCRWPVELIGPLQITYFQDEEDENHPPSNQKTFHLLLNFHVEIKAEIILMFDTTPANNFSKQHFMYIDSRHLPGFGELRFVDNPNFQLHHVRLFGRKAVHRLSQLFFPKQRGLLEDHLPLHQVAILQVDQEKEKCNFKVPLRQFLQQITLQPSKSSQLSPSPPPTFAVHRRQLNNGDNKATHGAPMELLELAISSAHLKAVWNRLTANMSHLVGGLRDLEVLSLETRSTFFPSVGYADAHSYSKGEDCCLKDNLCIGRDKWFPESVMGSPAGFLSKEGGDRFYVVREKNLESTTSSPPASAAVSPPISELIENTLKASKADRARQQGTVYVTVEYVKGRPRGPRNEALLYPPDTASLEAFLKAKNDKDGERVTVTAAAEGQGLAIGFVEFGCFSLDAARCRATAILSVDALEQLRTDQQALQERLGLKDLKKQSKLYAVIQSAKFNLCNLVTVAVMNVKDNWL